MAGSKSDTSGEKLKSEIAEQTRDIMREMFAEFKKEDRQERKERENKNNPWHLRKKGKSIRPHLRCDPLILIMMR